MKTHLHVLALPLLFVGIACGDVALVEMPEGEGDDPGECSDDADNDLDGLWDCDDPDCQGASVCAERGDDDDTGDD
ncbi:MAG TPA: hypothetical protein DIU15_04670, partial [Deltaproteobacteria bacterium]|nr:hypothetical protein [Deltaproteobacteria bacterium]